MAFLPVHPGRRAGGSDLVRVFLNQAPAPAVHLMLFFASARRSSCPRTAARMSGSLIGRRLMRGIPTGMIHVRKGITDEKYRYYYLLNPLSVYSVISE